MKKLYIAMVGSVCFSLWAMEIPNDDLCKESEFEEEILNENDLKDLENFKSLLSMSVPDNRESLDPNVYQSLKQECGTRLNQLNNKSKLAQEWEGKKEVVLPIKRSTNKPRKAVQQPFGKQYPKTQKKHRKKKKNKEIVQVDDSSTAVDSTNEELRNKDKEKKRSNRKKLELLNTIQSTATTTIMSLMLNQKRGSQKDDQRCAQDCIKLGSLCEKYINLTGRALTTFPSAHFSVQRVKDILQMIEEERKNLEKDSLEQHEILEVYNDPQTILNVLTANVYLYLRYLQGFDPLKCNSDKNTITIIENNMFYLKKSIKDLITKYVTLTGNTLNIPEDMANLEGINSIAEQIKQLSSKNDSNT